MGTNMAGTASSTIRGPVPAPEHVLLHTPAPRCYSQIPMQLHTSLGEGFGMCMVHGLGERSEHVHGVWSEHVHGAWPR